MTCGEKELSSAKLAGLRFKKKENMTDSTMKCALTDDGRAKEETKMRGNLRANVASPNIQLFVIFLLL